MLMGVDEVDKIIGGGFILWEERIIWFGLIGEEWYFFNNIIMKFILSGEEEGGR